MRGSSLVASDGPISAGLPSPWQDHLCRNLQRACHELARSVDQLRHLATARLPGRQPERLSQRQLESASSFLESTSPRNTGSGSGAARAAASAAPSAVTREDVGRAAWLFLHTLAAQYPEHPTRQQRRDARVFMDVLTRMYPCGECARHFRDVVAAEPPAVGSRHDFSQWMCRVHNVVNRSLGKPTFNCDLVEARWSGLECGEEEACTLAGARGGRR